MKHRFGILALASLLAACALPGGAGLERPDGPSAASAAAPSLAVLEAPSDKAFAALAKSGLDLLEDADPARRTVSALLFPGDAAKAQALGVKVNVSRAALPTRQAMPAGYRKLAEIDAEIDQLAAAHPELAAIETIGQSNRGRALRALRLTSRPGAGLPAVRIVSGMHARELPPVELTLKLAHDLVESAASPDVAELLASREIWIVPVANPDGRARVEGGAWMWRKNDNPASAVDINRNADMHWSEGSADPSADDFHGTAAFSEPETRALRDFATARRFVASIDVHCYGGMVLWPYGHTTTPPKDEARFAALAKPLAPLGYRAGGIAKTIYPTFGDFACWEYEKLGTLAMATELQTSGFGPGGFAPPYATVDGLWAKWRPLWRQWLKAVAS